MNSQKVYLPHTSDFTTGKNTKDWISGWMMMRVNAFGSIHYDPRIQDSIEDLAERSEPLVVEGLPKEKRDELVENIQVDLNLGFDIGDHDNEPMTADELEKDVIYLDEKLSFQEYSRVINNYRERLN